jgi:hypothetical protein
MFGLRKKTPQQRGMVVHLTFRHNMIAIMARAESEDGLTVGDMFMTIYPGEDFLGYTYNELYRLGEGEHELARKSQTFSSADHHHHHRKDSTRH